MRLALAGGGTGGHIVPGLHLLAHATGPAPDDVLWFRAGRQVEERALAGLPEASERVVLRLEPEGGGAPGAAGLAWRTAPAVLRARRALAEHGSNVLLGLGGFTCLPAVLAARSLGIGVALLEVNVVSGRATRWLAPLADRVLHAWPLDADADHRHVHTGPPLAPELTGPRPSPAEARRALGFAPDRPLLVVLGGSQGAGGLNAFLTSVGARAVVASGASVLHQTGPGRSAEGLGDPLEGYRAVEYVDDVPTALAAATGVLCRGGASTLAEVAAARAPAWVVPYPHHPDRHQERNARAVGDGLRIVPEGELGAGIADELAAWLGPAGSVDRGRRAEALAAAVPLDGAARIWRELNDMIRQ